jgi:hypothetical protein
MLEWIVAGSGACLMALAHHIDAEREWADARQFTVGKLDGGASLR